MEYIWRYLPSPGASNEVMHLYCGCADLRPAGGIHGLATEHEDIKVHVLPAEPVLTDLYCGRVNNAAALLCLQRSEEHTSELQSRGHLVCRLLLEKETNSK